MWTKAANYFENKMFSKAKAGQLYIFPTIDGMKLLGLNLILLIMGLVYANNYVLLFNFILFCLFIGSMFYTHFNLKGLILISANTQMVFVNELTHLNLIFKTRSTLGHHSITLKLKNPQVEISSGDFSFSILDSNKLSIIEVPVKGKVRGVSKISRVYLETKFPFHLFCVFTYCTIDSEVVCFPERVSGQCSQLENFDVKQDGADEFQLRSFRVGDSINKIHWKKFAQIEKLFTKDPHFENALPVTLSFSSKDLSKEETEKELSSLCHALSYLFEHNRAFGLSFDHITIPPGHSLEHLNNCLLELARYET